MNKCLLSVLLAVAGPCAAEVIEEVVNVPVVVVDARGKPVKQEIVVTVFRDTLHARSPYLVLNHGRAPTQHDRAKLGRARYADNSRYFVSKGFAVLVPTRVGYGVSGGADVENAGACAKPDYAVRLRPVVAQTRQVLTNIAALGYLDSTQGIVVGQSVGGFGAIAVSTADIPGLKAVINFSGGAGGDPDKRPESPCSPDELLQTFGDYGAKARVPSLWLYSVNDKYWGEQLPREWFAAYTKNGGKGQFVSLPAYKSNGHPIFTGNPQVWKRDFEQFLKGLNITAAR